MYSQVFELHSNLLKSLAHPRRLEIVNLLRDQELNVSQIYEMLDLPQANISQHLMILREADVLIAQREGKQIKYKLASPKVIAACDLLREVLIEQHKDPSLTAQLSQKLVDLVPLVHDPVCQMRISPKTAGGTTKYQEEDYYFCASGCLEKFKKNPEKYVKN